MSIIAVGAALETALAAISPAMATAWENVPFVPVAGVPYQRANLLVAKPDDAEIGGPFFIERGIFQVTLLYPPGTGRGGIMARAELIRAAFRQGAALSSAGIDVLISNVPEIAPGRNDADRYAVPISIPFRASCPI